MEITSSVGTTDHSESEINPRERLDAALRQFAGLYPSVSQVITPRTLTREQITLIGCAVDGLAVLRDIFKGLRRENLIATRGTN